MSDVPDETTLFIPLGPHQEMKITLTVQCWNRIDSDPRTLTRQPTLPEIITTVSTLHEILQRAPLASTLP